MKVFNFSAASLEGTFAFVCESPLDVDCQPCGVAQNVPGEMRRVLNFGRGLILLKKFFVSTFQELVPLT